MRKAYILLGIMVLIMIVTFATEGFTQIPLYTPYLGLNPYFYAFAPPPVFIPPLLSAPLYPPLPYLSAPVFSPVTRVGAATIILTNPTAGTVSVINPTVAALPAVTPAVPPAPTPLLSILAPLYASLLYESPLTTANPLLNAVLQTIFLL